MSRPQAIDESAVKRDPKTHRLILSLTDLEIGETLGVGLFSRVRLIRHKRLNKYFALKIFKKTELITRGQVEHVKQEIEVLHSLGGRHFPRFYGFVQDELRVYLMMEFVQGGALYTHLRTAGRFSEDVALFYICQLVLAVEQLQNLNIVHRDIKPENVMLSAEGNLVLVDFGFAKVVPDRTFTMLGCPEYIAPEVLQGNGYGKPVDWWAVGVLAYEMLTGASPFVAAHPYGVYKQIEVCRPNSPGTMEAGARDFVTAMLVKDSLQRLGSRGGAEAVKKHRWFKKVDWGAVRNLQVEPPFKPQLSGPDDLSQFAAYPDSERDLSHPLREDDRQTFVKMEEELNAGWQRAPEMQSPKEEGRGPSSVPESAASGTAGKSVRPESQQK